MPVQTEWCSLWVVLLLSLENLGLSLLWTLSPGKLQLLAPIVPAIHFHLGTLAQVLSGFTCMSQRGLHILTGQGSGESGNLA